MNDLPTNEARVWVSPQEEADRFLPEGPQLVAVEGRPAILWVNIQRGIDVPRGDIHGKFLDNGELRIWPQPARPSMLRATDQPDIIFLAREKELGTFDLHRSTWTPLATIPDTNPRTILNDGAVVPGGDAVVIGTKDLLFANPIASLYLYTCDDKRISVLAEGQVCSNGKVFARDREGLLLYDIDTPTRKVAKYRLDVVARTLQGLGTAIDLSTAEGFPDGMADCGDGTVIIAFYNPHRGGEGKAIRYRLDDGEVIEQWTTPGAPRVTCPFLFEQQGRVNMVLTTAVEGMEDELRSKAPNSGALFLAGTSILRYNLCEIVISAAPRTATGIAPTSAAPRP